MNIFIIPLNQKSLSNVTNEHQKPKLLYLNSMTPITQDSGSGWFESRYLCKVLDLLIY